MRRVLALLTVTACLLSPSLASASGGDVIRDCTDNGRIDAPHSQADYSSALANLPSDVDEYTDCPQIIAAAKRRDARRPPGAGGAALPGGFEGGTPPSALNVPRTPAERAAIASATSGAATPVTVAGEPITPGGSGIVDAAVRHSLPGPLLALLLALGTGALATIASGARTRGLQPPASALRLFDRAFPRRA
jgi:hypothetical protein